MRISDIALDTSITAADYDQLTCCDQPTRVAHASDTLPIPGAICEACWCSVTSLPGYGPTTVNHCLEHRA